MQLLFHIDVRLLYGDRNSPGLSPDGTEITDHQSSEACTPLKRARARTHTQFVYINLHFPCGTNLVTVTLSCFLLIQNVRRSSARLDVGYRIPLKLQRGKSWLISLV